MLSSTGWVQSIVIFLVSFFFFKTGLLPFKVALGFFWTGFFVNTSLVGAPGAFFNVGGATVFLMVAAAVKGFLAGAGVAAGFFSTVFSVAGFDFSEVFLTVTGAFFTGSGSFLAALTGSGFFSTLAGSFLSFLAGLGGSSFGRFEALPLGSSLTFFGSSLTFLGSSFFPLAGAAACCWPFLDDFTSGSLTFGFSGSAFLPLGSALADLGFSLAGSALTLVLDGCCVVGFLPLSFLLSATFFGAGALKYQYIK